MPIARFPALAVQATRSTFATAISTSRSNPSISGWMSLSTFATCAPTTPNPPRHSIATKRQVLPASSAQSPASLSHALQKYQFSTSISRSSTSNTVSTPPTTSSTPPSTTPENDTSAAPTPETANVYTNPYRAKRTWPPDMSKLSPKQQFRIERKYRRRAKLKWARPQWAKWTKLVQWGFIGCAVYYCVMVMDLEGGANPFMPIREYIYSLFDGSFSTASAPSFQKEPTLPTDPSAKRSS
ncbi:hypothetical protein FQN55_005563 [Onygenales sp. PD_40]|nr:hypothetical protein FQN55_005563 [Onygenales sp. PD_40]